VQALRLTLGGYWGDNISQSITLFTYYYSSAGIFVLESLLRASSALVLFECGRSCPSNCFIRASSALVLFECGRSCPSNRFFGPAAPWYYSSAGVLVPRIASSGLQRLRIIRVRALVPRIIFFGLATPSHYLSAGFGPSNHLHRASSASELFECGLWSLESFSLGQQRLGIIRVRAFLSLESSSSG
jgi:hypothetical protein